MGGSAGPLGVDLKRRGRHRTLVADLADDVRHMCSFAGRDASLLDNKDCAILSVTTGSYHVRKIGLHHRPKRTLAFSDIFRK